MSIASGVWAESNFPSIMLFFFVLFFCFRLVSGHVLKLRRNPEATYWPTAKSSAALCYFQKHPDVPQILTRVDLVCHLSVFLLLFFFLKEWELWWLDIHKKCFQPSTVRSFLIPGLCSGVHILPYKQRQQSPLLRTGLQVLRQGVHDCG